MSTKTFAIAAAGLSSLAVLLGSPGAWAATAARLVPGEGSELYVEIDAEGSLGGEAGVRFSAARFSVVRVDRGPEFPEGDGEIYFDMTPPGACPASGDLDGGLTFAWIFSADGSRALPSGRQRILTLVFEDAPAGGSVSGSCAVKFADCWGVPQAPVGNIITDGYGSSVPIDSTVGADLPCGVPFRRGDSNADGQLDISDAIYTLCVLFRGTCGVLACEDAADADDGGSINITDPIVLLGTLFLSYGPLPAPYPACGPDPTADGLTCDSFPSCAGR
jgi:hypothetical protein